MKKIWKKFAIIVFLCSICMLVAMQNFLLKGKGHSNRILQSAFSAKIWKSNVVPEELNFLFKINRKAEVADEDFTTADTEEQEDDIAHTAATYQADGVKNFNGETGDWKENITISSIPINEDSLLGNEEENGESEIVIAETYQKNQDDSEIVKKGDGSYAGVEDAQNKAEGQNPDPISVDSFLETCPEHPSNLVGPLNINSTYVPTEEEALEAAGSLLVDGCFKPTECIARQTVAIIVPYKDRRQHLLTLLYNLHPILQRQLIHYCVFVAEQFDNGSFNKARVMNAAFKEITNNHPVKFDCAIFHDVDMILEDDRNMHMCGKMPKHLSPAIDKFNYTLNYGTKFGGVTAIRIEHYKKLNGHSNRFWGWGGEDNDMELRIAHSNLSIIVTNKTHGRYKMIPHDHPWWFSPLYGVGSYLQSRKHWSIKGIDSSGLSDIQYSLRYTSKNILWTKLTIDIRTVLVEKAVVHFTGMNDQDLLFYSPSSATEDESTDPNHVLGIKPKQAEACSYLRFTGKTINKTLGLRERLTYGRMYKTLEEAKKKCDELKTFCGAIVEEHPSRFSLRASGYMHENRLRYRLGVVKQIEIIEKHHTLSVNVKTCPGDSSYMNFFKNPIVMRGDAKQGPSPSYRVSFDIRVFHDINTTLTYHSDMMTSHKSALQQLGDAGITEATQWDTMSHIYSSRHKILETSDAISLKKALPKEYSSIHELVNQGNGLLKVQTSLNGVLRHPGCYVCRSSLVDDTGAAILQWKWWFEIRATSPEIEEAILDAQLEKAKQSSVSLTETVEKRKEMWIQYHEQMKVKNAGNVQKGMPVDVINFVNKRQPPRGKPLR